MRGLDEQSWQEDGTFPKGGGGYLPHYLQSKPPPLPTTLHQGVGRAVHVPVMQ